MRRSRLTRTPRVPFARVGATTAAAERAAELAEERRGVAASHAWAKQVAKERDFQLTLDITSAHATASAARRAANLAPPGRQRAALRKARTAELSAWKMGEHRAERIFTKMTDPHPDDLEDRINHLDRGEFATREAFAKAWKIKAERHALRSTYAKDVKMYRVIAAKWYTRWTAARATARMRAKMRDRIRRSHTGSFLDYREKWEQANG